MPRADAEILEAERHGEDELESSSDGQSSENGSLWEHGRAVRGSPAWDGSLIEDSRNVYSTSIKAGFAG